MYDFIMKILELFFNGDIDSLFNIIMIVSAILLFKFIHNNLLANQEKSFDFDKKSLDAHINAQLSIELFKRQSITKSELLRTLYSLETYSDVEYLDFIKVLSINSTFEIELIKIQKYINRKVFKLKDSQLFPSVDKNYKLFLRPLWDSVKRINLHTLIISIISSFYAYLLLIIIILIFSKSYLIEKNEKIWFMIFVILVTLALSIFLLLSDYLVTSKPIYLLVHIPLNILIFFISNFFDYPKELTMYIWISVFSIISITCSLAILLFSKKS